MTGATGLLGHFILRDLLQRGRRIVAMLRPPLPDSKQRLSGLMRQLHFDLEHYVDCGQLVLVAGCLPHELPACNWGRTDDVLSCAASLQLFANGNEEPHKTNVVGTEKLLAWADHHDVRRFHAVSTAYVCGSLSKPVGEVIHHPKPIFQTEYEHSKWIAETRLTDWGEQDGRVMTISRPSFLVGDSETGYTSQFGGFYQLARMVSILKEQYSEGHNGHPTHVPLRIPGRPDDPQNFVPVDFASRVITEIVLNESLHGRIYHLTDPTPPTNNHVKHCLEDYFNIYGGHFVEPSRTNGDHTPAEALLWEAYDVITPRVTHNPVFQQDNTREVMDVFGIQFPALDRDRFFTLLDFAKARRWGLRADRSLCQ